MEYHDVGLGLRRGSFTRVVHLCDPIWQLTFFESINWTSLL